MKGSAPQDTADETHSLHFLRSWVWVASMDNLLFLSTLQIRRL